jgi:hypothetical protein
MTRKIFICWALVLLAGGLALGARYGLIEPASRAIACDANSGPWWCELRLLIIKTFATFGLGYLSLATSVLVLMTRTLIFGLIAAIVGVLALTLYCQEPGVVSFMLGALALARASWPIQESQNVLRRPTAAG